MNESKVNFSHVAAIVITNFKINKISLGDIWPG